MPGKQLPRLVDQAGLDAIAAPPDLPMEGDERDARFVANLAEEEARYLREENENLRSTREMRQTASRHAFGYLCALSGAVFVLLLADGFHIFRFRLGNVVLTTLSGGTFVSAISLFGIVVKGLFPNGQQAQRRHRPASREGSQTRTDTARAIPLRPLASD